MCVIVILPTPLHNIQPSEYYATFADRSREKYARTTTSYSMSMTDCAVDNLVIVSHSWYAIKTHNISKEEGSISNSQMYSTRPVLERLTLPGATQATCCTFFINESTVHFLAALERLLHNSFLILRKHAVVCKNK